MPDYIGPEYIDPVDNDALARARAKGPSGSAASDLGQIDPRLKEVMAAEHEYIERRRAYYGFSATTQRLHAALPSQGAASARRRLRSGSRSGLRGTITSASSTISRRCRAAAISDARSHG